MFAPLGSRPKAKPGVIANQDAELRRDVLVLRRDRDGHVPLSDMSVRTKPLTWNFNSISIFAPSQIGADRQPWPLPASPLTRAIQAKLEEGDLNDPLENEADRVADRVVGMPDPAMAAAAQSVQSHEGWTSAEKGGKNRTKPAGMIKVADLARSSVHEALRSPGQPMDASMRAYFEPRFGRDFSRVRLHSSAAAERSACDVNAQAYTVGDHIVFGPSRFAPGTLDGRRLVAHELAHAVQQSDAHQTSTDGSKSTLALSSSPGPFIQRKLLVTADSGPKRIRALFDLLEPTSGLSLAYDRKSQEVSITGFRALTSPVPGATSGPRTALPSLARGTPSSPTLAVRLEEIIEDPKQNAELRLGGPQPGVSFGEFPTSGPLIQVIDIDDLVRLDAGAPGSGVATLFHEIVENYRAHASDQPGLFPSHEAGLEAEAQVAGELVAPGERVAEALVDKGKGVVRWVRDYERYFLVYDRGPPDNRVLNAWQASRVNVGTFKIEGFSRGSDAVPTGAQPEIEAVANAMRLNPAATVRIDCGGGDRRLALRRAQRVQDAILDNGKGRNLFGFDLRGERNFNLVASGLAGEGAVITVDQPDTEVASLRGSIVKRVLPGPARRQPASAGLPDWRPRR
jgi:hypothetical protein